MSSAPDGATVPAVSATAAAPAARRRPWRTALRIGPVALVAGALGTASVAQPGEPAPAEPGSLAAVVAGIVGYTRWPAEPTPLRLCTLGTGAGVAELHAGPAPGSPQRDVQVRTATPADALAGRCEVLYVGRLERSGRELIEGLSGKPVLLLGEGSDFCSDGGMFCLQPDDTAVRFKANLDAIARSGLRVNPLVLRIARGGRS